MCVLGNALKALEKAEERKRREASTFGTMTMMGWKAKKNVIYEQKFQKTLYDKAWVWEIKLWMATEAKRG